MKLLFDGILWTPSASNDHQRPGHGAPCDVHRGSEARCFNGDLKGTVEKYPQGIHCGHLCFPTCSKYEVDYGHL